jgi:flagellar protein FlaG
MHKMSFDIGPIHSQRPLQGASPARRPASVDGATFEATLQSATAVRPLAPARVDTAHVGIPASPPPEVLDAIGAAADRVDALAAENRELHFHKDEETGRVVVEVRNLATGEIVRTIPPSGALAAVAGSLEA